MGLIRILHYTGKTKLNAPKPKPGAKASVNPGRRNDANGFDITPVIDLITRAKAARKAAKLAAQQKYVGGDAT